MSVAPRPPDQGWHALPVERVLAGLEADAEGLDAVQAAERLHRHGSNALPANAGRSALRRLLAQFDSLFIYVLLGSALVVLALGEYIDAAVIVLVVLINAVIGYLQEGRAEQALAAVRGMLTTQAAVLRAGRRVSVPAAALVPGDVVLLEPGDRVGADLRLLHARNLRIEESALTGESVPVGKDCAPVAGDAALGDRRCMAWSGTLVASGQGRGVVVATGTATELGRISTLLGAVVGLKTPLLRQMDAFTRGLTLAILAISALAFAFAWLLRGHVVADAFMVAIGIAVAAIPEGLPVVVTITLALGVQRMARRRAIVRQLPAVETLGCVSVICSDKTGTLTRNEMAVVAVATADADFTIEGVGYRPQGRAVRDGTAVAPGAEPVLHELARAAALCNDAGVRETDGQWRVDGDPMEGALRVLAWRCGLDDADLAWRHPRLDEIPFDAAHCYMATLHGDGDGDAAGRLLCLKGAPEQVLALCASERLGDGERPLDAPAWLARVQSLAAGGQRVLALAQAGVDRGVERLDPQRLDQGLVLLGLVGLIDPPRPEAVAAVAECRRAGIGVKMITGDHLATAAAIAGQLGLERTGDPVSGSELDGLDDTQLRLRVAGSDVFARTSPEHKLRLVQALQAGGAVVAMTGDGVNDAPALKRADVGVAMGIQGTEAAKEAAKVVLADDNFATIVAAVREGRTIHDNIRKAIAWSLPTNGGEALVILAALLLGWTLPITPVQILWVNMVTAVTLGLTFAFEPGEPGLMRRPPRPPGEGLLSPFLIWRVLLVSALFAAFAFAAFAWAQQRGLALEAARTVVVNVVVALEVFYLFSVRFLERSSLNWAGVLGTPAVLAALALVVALQLAFTYMAPLQAVFQTRALGPEELAVVVMAGVALLSLLELEKWLLRRRPRPQRT